MNNETAWRIIKRLLGRYLPKGNSPENHPPTGSGLLELSRYSKEFEVKVNWQLSQLTLPDGTAIPEKYRADYQFARLRVQEGQKQIICTPEQVVHLIDALSRAVAQSARSRTILKRMCVNYRRTLAGQPTQDIEEDFADVEALLAEPRPDTERES